jgi:hypothetical protein
MTSAKWPTAAPLRMSNNLHCGYWSAVSPCVSSTQAGGPPRQQRQRSSATLPREKTPRTLCGNPLPPLPVGRSAGGRSGALLPVWTAAMAGPAASLPGVRFGRGRGLHRRCCPLLRLWGRLRWPDRRTPPALPGWEGRCPWCPPLAVRRRRGRCRGLHQRCHSCMPLALDLPPRWRFGPGALGQPAVAAPPPSCCCWRGRLRWNKLPLGSVGAGGVGPPAVVRRCCGSPTAAVAAVGLPVVCRAALRCPLPGRATPSGPGRGVLRVCEECRRASARRQQRRRPTAAPAPPHLPRWKEKARLLRTPLRQGRLFGGTGQRGGVESVLPELLAHRKRQRRQRVSTACSCVFVCGEVSGDPLPLLPGSRPYRAPVCWRSRRNRHHAQEAESARPVARQFGDHEPTI